MKVTNLYRVNFRQVLVIFQETVLSLCQPAGQSQLSYVFV